MPKFLKTSKSIISRANAKIQAVTPDPQVHINFLFSDLMTHLKNNGAQGTNITFFLPRSKNQKLK